MRVVYLVAVAQLGLTVRISLIGTESVPPHRLCSVLLHTDAMLHSHAIATMNDRKLQTPEYESD